MKIPKEVSEFLEKEKFCVIATSSKGKTEAATMSAIFRDDEVLMFTSKITRKYANLRENNNVALVFSSSDYSKNAQIDGEAEIAESKSIADYIIQKRPELKQHIENEEHGEIAFIVVKPKRIYFCSRKPNKEMLIE